jgi:hypothetical protein
MKRRRGKGYCGYSSEQDKPPPLRAACRGEHVHAALHCAPSEGGGFGCVAAAGLVPGELLLVARGLRFSSASATPECRDGGLFLAEALQQLQALTTADPSDAAALLRSWRALCPRPPVPHAQRAPLLAQSAALAEVLAQHGPRCGVSTDELVDLVLKIECNAFEGGHFPLAACFNHSCRPNVAMALQPRRRRRQQEEEEGEEEGEGEEVYEARALVGVGAGEELCINYLGLPAQHRGRWERRAQLARGPRGFVCRCAACAGVGAGADDSGTLRCAHDAQQHHGTDDEASSTSCASGDYAWLVNLADEKRHCRRRSGSWCVQTALESWSACERCSGGSASAAAGGDRDRPRCRPAASAAELAECERVLRAPPANAAELWAPRWGVRSSSSLAPATARPRPLGSAAACGPWHPMHVAKAAEWQQCCGGVWVICHVLGCCVACVARGGDEAGRGRHAPAALATLHGLGGTRRAHPGEGAAVCQAAFPSLAVHFG